MPRLISIIEGIFKEVWRIFDSASFYILFGLFIAGTLQIFLDKDKIARHLGRPGIKSVILAALFGVPLPLCSCGVIPTAVSLRRGGASKGAVLSFLISTPESGIDSIFLSYALLDPLMTVFRPLAAFITAFIAGISENALGRKEEKKEASAPNICEHCDEEEEHSHDLLEKFRYGMRYAFGELLSDIAHWLAIGIAAAGIISYLIPVGLIENYLGSGLRSMLVMLFIGIPLYICASASTPIAAALIVKGMSPGAALVFLLAGPATNAAGILAVGKFLDKRAAVIYLVSISVCSVGLGLLLNQIYQITGINIKAVMGQAGEILPDYVRVVSSVILIALMLKAMLAVRKCK